MSEVFCGADPCPVILNSTCVFYRGQDLLYIGVNTNDPLQTVIEKINQAFQNSGIGYAFNNGLVQSTPFDPVQLGGSLIQNTTIGGSFTLTFVGNVQAAKHITTGGTSSQFVKGDGTLDSTNYQPAGNYLTALSGDGSASGPGVGTFTLSTVNFSSGTFGSSTLIPIVTVNSKGLVTNVTTTSISVPAQSLSFIGDVVGSGITGTNVTLSLQNVNSNVYGSNTFLKFAVNAKGLVTSATPVGQSDIISALGYTPVSSANVYTQSQINSFFAGSTPISGYNKVNWDTAYGDKINSAIVSGGSTKTLILYQQDGGTITATWTESPALVSSVFGRVGAVIAQSGDYNTSQVTESTNLYFTEARVLSTLLSGYILGTNTPLSATDNVLQAFQNIQAQLNNKQNLLTNPITGLLTTNYIPKATGANTLADSVIYETLGSILIGGTTSDGRKFQVIGSDITVHGITVGRGADNVATNTVIGFGAAAVLTGSANSVVIGYQAAGAATNIYETIAIGYQAAYNSTGGNAIYIGRQSGYNSPSSTASIFIGESSGRNTTGARNIFIGHFSGSGNTSGQLNVSMGYESGRFLSTGIENTAIGGFSGFDLSATTGNTFLGYDSGRNINTGNYNVALGHKAGEYRVGLSSLTNSSNSIFIGYRAKADDNSQTNQIVIGHDAVGLGSNTTIIGNSSTTHGRWYGNFLLGTNVNSGYLLDVNGTARIQSDLTVTATNATGDFATIDASSIIRRRTAAQVLSDIGAQPTLTNPITGTGTSGQVSFFNGTTTLTGDNGLFWDNTNNRLGIGTNAPAAKVNVKGAGATSATTSFLVQNSANNNAFQITDDRIVKVFNGLDLSGWYIYANGITNASFFGGTSWIFDTVVGGVYRFRTAGNVDRLRIESNGNILINTTTDAGFRLDVNGTARVQGDLTITATNPRIQTSGNVFQINSTYGIYIGTPGGNVSIASFTNNLFGQNTSIVSPCTFGVENTLAHSSSLIDMRSTTRGFLPPRLTTTQRNAIATPATGLEVYNSTNNSKDIYNGSAWVNVVSSSNFDGLDIAFGTTTGTKIGTATSQKLSLWNATPNVQPTTAITAGAFVANTSGITDDTATFDGYTMGQVVAALRRIGALA